MTEAEKNYKNGKYNPYPLMKKYSDIMDKIGEIIEEELNPIQDEFVNISRNLPNYSRNLSGDAESLAGKIGAVTSTLYQLIDECDHFSESLYWSAWKAGKKDYMESKANKK